MPKSRDSIVWLLAALECRLFCPAMLVAFRANQLKWTAHTTRRSGSAYHPDFFVHKSGSVVVTLYRRTMTVVQLDECGSPEAAATSQSGPKEIDWFELSVADKDGEHTYGSCQFALRVLWNVLSRFVPTTELRVAKVTS